jgi:hypothetical protein
MSKRIVSTLLLLLLGLGAGATYAQENTGKSRLRFGVRAGLTETFLQDITTRDDGRIIESFEGSGWQVGGSVYFPDTIVGYCLNEPLGTEVGLFFSERRYCVGDTSNSLYYVEIPLMLSYAKPIFGAKKVRLAFQLGSYVGVGLAGDGKAFTDHLRRFNFGLRGGLGMEFGRFFVGTSYSYGVFNVARNAPRKHTQRLSSADLTIGWNF